MLLLHTAVVGVAIAVVGVLLMLLLLCLALAAVSVVVAVVLLLLLLYLVHIMLLVCFCFVFPVVVAVVAVSDAVNQVNCSARGDPAPKITWLHNGREAKSRVKYHVNQFPPRADPQGLGFVSEGTLGIFPLTEEDSGSVECVAGVVADDETTGGEVVPKDTAATSLAILGEFLKGSCGGLDH